MKNIGMTGFAARKDRISELEAEVERLNAELERTTEALCEAEWTASSLRAEAEGARIFAAGLAYLLAVEAGGAEHDWVLRYAAEDMGANPRELDEEKVLEKLSESDVRWASYILETAEELGRSRRAAGRAAAKGAEDAILACVAAGHGPSADRARRRLVGNLDPNGMTGRVLRDTCPDAAEAERRYLSGLSESLAGSIRNLMRVETGRKPTKLRSENGREVLEGFSIMDCIPDPFAGAREARGVA